MLSRKSVIEVLLALFITGCVVFFAERGSESSPALALSTVTPKSKVLLKDDSRHFKALQNCTNSQATNYSFYNATSMSYQFVQQNTSACTTSVQTAFTVVVATSEAVITYPFQSQTFQMVLNMPCLTSTSTVTASIASTLGVDPSQINILTSSCGSLILTYVCGSLSSAADAMSLCSSINTQACNPSTNLGRSLQGISCTQVSNTTKGSSTALFGLFALCAIPILIVFALFLWYRTSQREADNQYMQDTATFSNVATAPQPLGPKPAYPAAPVYTTVP